MRIIGRLGRGGNNYRLVTRTASGHITRAEGSYAKMMQLKAQLDAKGVRFLSHYVVPIAKPLR